MKIKKNHITTTWIDLDLGKSNQNQLCILLHDLQSGDQYINMLVVLQFIHGKMTHKVHMGINILNQGCIYDLNATSAFPKCPILGIRWQSEPETPSQFFYIHFQ